MTSVDTGDSLHTIPETVVLCGTFRAFSNSSFYQLLKRIREVSQSFKLCIEELTFYLNLKKAPASSATGLYRTSTRVQMFSDSGVLRGQGHNLSSNSE